MSEVRVALPVHLRTLAKVDGEVRVEAAEPVTIRTIDPFIRDCVPGQEAGPGRTCGEPVPVGD